MKLLLIFPSSLGLQDWVRFLVKISTNTKDYPNGKHPLDLIVVSRAVTFDELRIAYKEQTSRKCNWISEFALCIINQGDQEEIGNLLLCELW